MSAILKRREEGQSLVEYAAILVLVAVVIIIVLVVFGDAIYRSYNCIVMSLNAIQESPIVGITLMNSNTDQDITPLCGQNVDLASLPNGSLTIRANTKGQVGSVKMELTGPTTTSRTESFVPYSLFGDDEGDFAGGSFAPGDYSLTATAYSEAAEGGSVLGTMTITFSMS